MIFEEKENKLEPAESFEVDSKRETIHFPWAMAIIIGVLMLLIVICLIVVMVLGPETPAETSSSIANSMV